MRDDICDVTGDGGLWLDRFILSISQLLSAVVAPLISSIPLLMRLKGGRLRLYPLVVDVVSSRPIVLGAPDLLRFLLVKTDCLLARILARNELRLSRRWSVRLRDLRTAKTMRIMMSTKKPPTTLQEIIIGFQFIRATTYGSTKNTQNLNIRSQDQRSETSSSSGTVKILKRP